ncbi:MAG TPA: MlaD family protein [Methylomirabilota bacterium]|nr:MlaD family protein [Methylomirabilota bacterium]
METRASYIAVGSFVLALFVGLLGFVVWIGKFQGQVELARYDILFDGSVTGLQVDGTVRYRGIAVGRVTDIRIDPENIEKIRVTIEVKADTPVRTDTVASIELQGITGGTYILLSGGTQAMKGLPTTTTPPYPVIASKPSALEKLFEGAPELIAKANLLVDRVTLLFSDENEKAISDTLQNLRSLTGGFVGGGTSNVEILLKNGAAAAEKVGNMSDEFQQLAKDLRNEFEGKGGAGGPTIADVLATGSATMQQLQKTGSEFELLAHDLRTQLLTPTNGGPSVADLVREGTSALQRIQTMSTQFEQLAQDVRKELVAGGGPNGKTVGDLLNSADTAATNLGRMSAQVEQLARDLGVEIQGMSGEHGAKVSDLLTKSAAAMDQIRTMGAQYEQLAHQLGGNFDKLTGQAGTTLVDLQHTAADFRTSAESFTQLANQLDKTVSENRGPIRDFTGSGLYELSQLLSEMRTLVASMTRISSQIERDPARFFFGDRRQGFEAQ